MAQNTEATTKQQLFNLVDFCKSRGLSEEQIMKIRYGEVVEEVMNDGPDEQDSGSSEGSESSAEELRHDGLVTPGPGGTAIPYTAPVEAGEDQADERSEVVEGKKDVCSGPYTSQ